MTALIKLKRGIVVVAMALGASGLSAQNESLSLEEAERIALEEEPQILALNDEAEAFENVALASHELPDVQVRSGLMNFPLEHGGFRTEGMTQIALGVRQNIPPRGQRLALSQKNENLAHEKREQAKNRTRYVVKQVRTTWLEAYFRDQVVSLVAESRDLFVELARIARSLYAVGSRNQHDVLQAELELLKLDDRLIQAKQDQKEAYAQLEQLLGQAVVVPVEDKLPEWNSVPPMEQLRDRLLDHPLVAARDALLRVNNAQQEFEESGLNPSWSVDLGYSYRDGQLQSGKPRSDFLSASFSFSVPFLRGERQRRQISAASLRKQSTSHGRSLLLRDLHYELAIAHSRWETLSNRLALYEESMIRQSHDHAQASLGAYRNKVVGLSDVARSYIEQIDTQLAYKRLQVDQLKTWALIDSLADINP